VSLDVRWEPLTEDRPLLDLLPPLPDDRRFAFVAGGDGVVGWGVAARIPVGTGPDRFARARDGLTALAATAVDGPLAFASFTFDEDDDTSVMVVPAVAVVRRGAVTRRMTVVTGDVSDAADVVAVDPSVRMPTSRPAGSARDGDGDRPRYAGSTVRDEVWLEAVAEALEEIAADAYEKVVLARDLNLWSRRPFDVDRLLRDLAARFPSCMTFLVDHLLGASPERLLLRRGTTVAARVLAGTARRGADPTEDAALGAALLGSPKDRHEHDLALRSAAEVLAPLCTMLDVPTEPSLVRLDNVQHLGSDLTGTLDAARDTHVLTVLAALHPTAAVGGSPRTAALDAIRRLEGISRGRYAGPVGWCTPDGDGEFAIALRCAEVRGDRARLFAGAGVVAGSLPEAELTETWLKLRAMTGVLDR
jgi:menaquinone-specific isochorismate synthase